MEPDAPLLEVEDLVAGYGEIEVLRGLSVSVRQGEIASIIGANGAGKSTLLRTLYGMVKVRQGAVRFQGQDITNQPSREILGKGISFVPQGRCNFPGMSVLENLEMGAFTRGDSSVSHDILAMLGRFSVLNARRKELAGNLSGGEQQILELAMALLLSPKVMMVDEPSMGLSPKMVDYTFDALREIREHGTTILLVEQNANKALSISDRGIVLELGRVSFDARAEDVLADERIRRQFLGA